MSKPVGSKQRKLSATVLDQGPNPAIAMTDKIRKIEAERKQKDLDKYNQLCGPIKITYRETSYKVTVK